MTVIVLDTDKDSIVLAADSQWTEDTDIVFYRTKLVPIMRGQEQIGAVATSGDALKGIRLENLLKQKLAKLRTADPLDAINEVVLSRKEELTDTLIVYRGVGYQIDPCGLVYIRTRWAIGAGSLVALGAMWRKSGSASKIAMLGCEAAIDLTASCGGPIDIFEMPRKVG